MGHRTIPAWVLFVCLGWIASDPVRAFGAEAAQPCMDDERCSALVVSASALSKAGQFAAAEAKYQEAIRLHPEPWLRMNLGRLQQKQGRPAEAVETYRAVLREPDAARDAEVMARIGEYLRQAELDAAQQRLKLAVTPTATPRTPLYKKWWLWTAVGAAAIGLGAGLGVGLTRGPSVMAPPALPAGTTVLTPVF